jgi:hypothetical protein
MGGQAGRRVPLARSPPERSQRFVFTLELAYWAQQKRFSSGGIEAGQTRTDGGFGKSPLTLFLRGCYGQRVFFPPANVRRFARRASRRKGEKTRRSGRIDQLRQERRRERTSDTRTRRRCGNDATRVCGMERERSLETWDAFCGSLVLIAGVQAFARGARRLRSLQDSVPGFRGACSIPSPLDPFPATHSDAKRQRSGRQRNERTPPGPRTDGKPHANRTRRHGNRKAGFRCRGLAAPPSAVVPAASVSSPGYKQNRTFDGRGRRPPSFQSKVLFRLHRDSSTESKLALADMPRSRQQPEERPTPANGIREERTRKRRAVVRHRVCVSR